MIKSKQVISLLLCLVFIMSANVYADSDIFAEFESNAEEEVKNDVALHNDIYCAVDGKAVNITGCVLKADRVYVPIKPIFEAMGFLVTYVAKTRQVGLIRGDSKILIDLGKGLIIGTLVADSKTVELNAALDDSVEIDGAIYIPIRNIAENMYCKVDWQQGASTVYIQSPSLKDVQTNEVVIDDIGKYLGDLAGEYYKKVYTVLNNSRNLTDISKQIEMLEEVLGAESSSGIEIETARVFTNFKTKMIALSNLTEKPEYNESQSWDSVSYTGYDEYRASSLELKRLGDRLEMEYIITSEGNELLHDIVDSIEANALM